VESAADVGERVREAIQRESGLTASIGCATWPDHGPSAERLVRQADAALYVAKRTGKNRLSLATMA
jgi:diguanylate cyclase (GGDEF)-like protein